MAVSIYNDDTGRREYREIEALLFDLDGVITETARLHAMAWKALFDSFLDDHFERTGKRLAPFSIATDYPIHVDGKPRLEGLRSFLASRGIFTPGQMRSTEPEVVQTITELGQRKNHLFLKLLAALGVKVFPDAIGCLKRACRAGVKTAVVSSSRNCSSILERAKLYDYFDVRIDGVYAATNHLKGKPEPDTFIVAAALLGIAPKRAAVIEDAMAGVEAGRAGGFGTVIGLDRLRQKRQALKSQGADLVISTLDAIDFTVLGGSAV